VVDQSIVNLDPALSDSVRYELGAGNWRPPGGGPWIPDLANAGGTVRLADHQVIDVVILGDGYQTRDSFESQLTEWLADFYGVEVYDRFAGAFRIRAYFRESDKPCTGGEDRGSFYRVKVGTSGDDAGEVATGGWWAADGTDNTVFRQRLFESLDAFRLNLRTYPGDLDVDSDPGTPGSLDTSTTVIHNQLAGMYSNLVVVMLVRTAGAPNTSGRTREVPDMRYPVPDAPKSMWRTVNVAFGSHALHEFGHAFAYLEDEYISKPNSSADRSNPLHGSVFTLSNLSFSRQLDEVPWRHVSPWGRRRRQAAGDEASPIVGWLWRGGEDGLAVWHSEYHCLMNGGHHNFAYSTTEMPPAGADLRFRRPPRYCLWCQEIVTIRILEKTGQLAAGNDPANINERGRHWYSRWVNTWRDRYWAAFDVDAQIDEREMLYANPASEPATFSEIQNGDGSYKRLDKSDLYQAFTAAPPVGGIAPDDDEDAILAMLACL